MAGCTGETMYVHTLARQGAVSNPSSDEHTQLLLVKEANPSHHVVSPGYVA